MCDPLGPEPDDPTLSRVGVPGDSSARRSGTTQPRSIGDYPILRELGRGGMGVVYLARDPRLERDVALKLLPPELSDHAEARERFLDEARTLAALNHPNIATIYSLEDDRGRHFLTMELIDGCSLWEHLRSARPSVDEVLALARHVARAVEAAHSRGIIHRDIKPTNVMVQETGTAKVLDFGLAVRLRIEPGDAGSAADARREIAGTPGYMSPEQARGEAADPRSDVWAVGCLLYECLAGRPLIAGETVADKLAKTTSVDAGYATELESVQATLSPRLARLLKRCLEADIADRFATMHEVRVLLEEEIAERALPRADGLEPTSRHAPPPAGNLPRRQTSFVGRQQDLDELARLLECHPLISIVGAGGCGKTRLSLEFAGRAPGSFPDGSWLVELASIADPDLVPARAAAVLDAPHTPGTSALDSLIAFLTDKRMLIVFDNCEHLVDAAATLAERVLAVCPHVRIVATSREALRVEGEAVHVLLPLPLPDATEPSEAEVLFVDRAQAVLPSFEVDDSNRAAIREICARLDCIPLAIELAAARVKALPVDKIRDLLSDRFRLLTRGTRTAQPHQSTLRALIDWSYDRLDPSEQALLRRLSVFRGAWRLEAVEAVGAGGDLQAWDVLDVFTRLVEKSMIVHDVAAGTAASARYYMLETMRAYSHEKLRESGEEEQEAIVRHRDYIVALSLEGENGLRGRDQAQWTAWLTDAADDIRAVLERSAEDPDGAEAVLSVAGSYWFHWYNRGMWQEGLESVDRALAHPGADRTSTMYGRALVGGGNLAYRMGDYDRSRAYQEEALAVLTESGDDVQVASVHLNLGNIAYARGEYDEAQRSFEASLAGYRRANATVWIAGCLSNISALALVREDLDSLETMQSEVLEIYESAGIRDHMCLPLLQLGMAAFARELPDLARERWERALALAEEFEHGWNTMAALVNIAFLEVSLDQPDRALEPLVRCMSILTDMRDTALALPVIEMIAAAAGDQQSAKAAALFAAAASLRAELRMPLLSYELPVMSRVEARLTGILGEEQMEHTRAAGERMSLDDALSAAQELLEHSRG